VGFHTTEEKVIAVQNNTNYEDFILNKKNIMKILKIEKPDKKALIDFNDGHIDVLERIIYYQSEKDPNCILYKFIGRCSFTLGDNYETFLDSEMVSKNDGHRLIYEDEFDYDEILEKMQNSEEHKFVPREAGEEYDHSKEELDRMIKLAGFNVEEIKFNQEKKNILSQLSS